MKLKHLFIAACMLLSLRVSAARNPLTQWTVFTGNYSYLNDKITTAIKLHSDAIADIAIDNNGNLLFACNRFGIIKWDGKTLTEIVANKSSLAANADMTTIACDSKNNIYIGTNKGLSVFNGTAWTDFMQDATGISIVKNIAITQTDKVYITGDAIVNKEVIYSNILSFYNGSSWTQNNISNGVPDKYMQNLTIDESNHVWVSLGAQNEKGLARFDGKNWKLYNSGTGLPTNDIMAITTNSSGKMWFATPQGVLELNNGEWKMHNFSNSYGKKLIDILTRNNNRLDIQSIAIDNANTIWIATSNNGLMALTEDGYKAYTSQNSPINNNYIKRILVDKNNNKWLGTSYSSVMSVKEFNLPMKDVSIINSTTVNVDMGASNSIIQDKQGNVWATSDNSGLLKIKDNKLELFQHEKGSLSSMFVKAYAANDNKIYITAAMGGIKVFDNGAISDYAKSPTFGGATDITTDADNVLWAASSGGLSKFANNAWETYNKGNGGLPSIIVYCVFKDSKNQIWAGTGKGLVKYTGNNTFQVFTKKEVPFPSDDILTINESKDGKMWFGSKRGISVFDGTNWTHYEKIESLNIKNFAVNAICFDKYGNAWIGTETNGLLKFDGTNFTQTSKDNSKILYDKITALCISNDNKLYIASSYSEFLDRPFYMEMNNEDKLFSGINKRINEGEPKHLITILNLNN
ncbi:MAG: hypothetical protein RJA07_1552 [Bacteroidota bacterium]|jgi:ligand-binding sensor domain-containing protein